MMASITPDVEIVDYSSPLLLARNAHYPWLILHPQSLELRLAVGNDVSLMPILFGSSLEI